MLVKTNFLGVEETIEVSEEQIFSFEPGLGGFESLRRYALIPEADSPVDWLQSLDDPEVAFALLEPFSFAPNYAFELQDADSEALGMQEPQDALVRCVLTLHEDPTKITANMLAPLVLCRRTHLARQIIVQDGAAMDLRFPLFSTAPEMGDVEMKATA